jgi:hypothetical protein
MYNADGKFDVKEYEKNVDNPGGEKFNFITVSKDNGLTWSEPVPIASDALKYASPYGKIINAPDGEMLMCFAGYDKGHKGFERSSVYLMRSTDGGRTWGDESLVARDHNETSFAFLPDGTLVAAARHAKGWLSVMRSGDKGYTWSAPVQATRINEHPADLTCLKSGRLLMTFGKRIFPMGCSALISDDGGLTWNTDAEIQLAGDGRTLDLGYPSTIQLNDGTIITAIYYACGSGMHDEYYGWGFTSCQALHYTEDDIT